MDESMIIEIWDTFKEYIPEKNKDMAANQYVDFLLGKDIEPAARAATAKRRGLIDVDQVIGPALLGTVR